MPVVHPTLNAAITALSSITMAVVALVSAGGYGWPLHRALGLDELTPFERTLFSLTLGLATISLLTFLAGALGAWTPFGARVILFGGLVVSSPFLKNVHFQRLDACEQRSPSVFMIALGLVWMILLALAPITYYDALVYHMAMPAAYVQAHHWIPLKELIYSAFPQNLEMLWTFGLLVANDHLSNFLALALALIGAGAVFTFARRYFSAPVGLTSVALLLAMPCYLLLSSGAYVDVGLAAFGFLSFYALNLWMDSARIGPLVAAGLLAGFTMGIKYTGAIPVAIGALFIFFHDRRSISLALVDAALFTGCALLVMSPWLIKNWHYVGNPVFPFFYEWGNQKLSPWVQGAAQGYFRGLSEYQPRTLLTLLRLPWDLTMNSIHFGNGMDILGNYGWMPLVLITPFLPLCKEVSDAARRLLIYAGLFILPWALTRPVLRFLIPLAPVLALLAGRAWTQGVRQASPVLTAVLSPILAMTLAFGYLMFFSIVALIAPFHVPLGLETRDHYLSHKLNYYGAAQFVNSTSAVTRVFVLGDQRGYYYNKPVTVTPVFNRNPFVDWADQATSAEALLTELRRRGFSHLVVNNLEMNRLASYGIFGFSVRGWENWTALHTKLARVVYSDPACEVLAL